MLTEITQDEAAEASLDTLKEMEDETKRLRDTTSALKVEEKELRLSLREGASQAPLSELKAAVTSLEEQKAEMTARLAKLKGGDVKPVSLEERETVGGEHRKWQMAANARKKIRTELWKEIEGWIEKEKVADTKEELGLEF
jgi:26S proteasome regulatory subunit (ATPase 3-interacting protein)